MDHAPATIDHLVLPVRDLDLARARYEALGFRVAAEARHPFGTENACIFLQDGTYLEPLGIADRTLAEIETRKGNPFLRRDQAYRFRVDDEGFSMLAMRSDDAAADLASFVKQGFGFGQLFPFSRMAKTLDGEIEIGVKLGFAADDRAPDAAFFACERINMEPLWSADRTAHENGVTGLSAVLLSEENPTDFQYLLQAATGMRDFASSSNGLSFHMDGADLFCFTPVALQQLFAIPSARTERGVRFEGAVFTCQSIASLTSRYAAAGIDCFVHLGRLIVPAAPGQGVPFVFEEAAS
tara:strand:- start:2170 stop:3057 length:888 start_codon:yes stop_codon:yes gene_type:complete